MNTVPAGYCETVASRSGGGASFSQAGGGGAQFSQAGGGASSGASFSQPQESRVMNKYPQDARYAMNNLQQQGSNVTRLAMIPQAQMQSSESQNQAAQLAKYNKQDNLGCESSFTGSI